MTVCIVTLPVAVSVVCVVVTCVLDIFLSLITLVARDETLVVAGAVTVFSIDVFRAYFDSSVRTCFL